MSHLLIPAKVIMLLALALAPGIEVAAQDFRVFALGTGDPGRRCVAIGFEAREAQYGSGRSPAVLLGGRRLRPQVHIRSRWPDGSPRHVKLVVPLPCPGEG